MKIPRHWHATRELKRLSQELPTAANIQRLSEMALGIGVPSVDPLEGFFLDCLEKHHGSSAFEDLPFDSSVYEEGDRDGQEESEPQPCEYCDGPCTCVPEDD